MAETLATAFGIIAFIGQTTACVRSLKKTYRFNRDEAADEFNALSRHIKVLKDMLPCADSASTSTPTNEVVVLCADIHRRLEEIHGKLAEEVGALLRSGNVFKRAGRIFSLDIKEKLDEVKMNICQLTSLSILQETKETRKLIEHIQLLLEQLQDIQQQQPHPNLDAVTELESSSIEQKPACQRRRTLQAVVMDCTSRQCFCSCHLVKNLTKRYWSMRYTPLSILFGDCNISTCTARLSKMDIRFCLRQYGIPVAIQTAFELVLKGTTLRIQPSLSIQTHVVPYTSPMFEVLERCMRDYISIDKACQWLADLARQDPNFRKHVDPSGKDYIQTLVHYPWGWRQDDQFRLLEFFCIDLGCTMSGYDQMFLVQCAEWIGEGRHLDLLDSLIELGFDPGQLNSPIFQQWPAPCSPNWISPSDTPDPFYLEYIGILCGTLDGFAGSTPFQRAVYHDDLETVNNWKCRTCPLSEDRNFLGQTPLHVAIYQPTKLQCLINAGHDLNVTDNWGITPLMYAAAMGDIKVVRTLVLHGANPCITDHTYSRNFVDYAATRRQWKPLVNMLEDLQPHIQENDFQRFVFQALVAGMATHNWYPIRNRIDFCTRLFSLAKDINLPFGDKHKDETNNNLMHYVQSVEEAEGLVRHGFTGFHLKNSKGHTPLAVLAATANAPVFTYCLQHIDIGHDIDTRGIVLVQLVSKLTTADWLTWDAVDALRAYLQAIPDIPDMDNCQCHCAPNGCSISILFSLNLHDCILPYESLDFIWALEWTFQVQDYFGYEAAKRVLLGLIRRSMADEIGAKHSCCHLGRGLKPAQKLFAATSYQSMPVLVLSESDEQLIEVLEHEMQGMSEKTLQDLLSLWLRCLKPRHNQYLQEVKERQRLKKNFAVHYIREDFGVDSWNDKFIHGSDLCIDFEAHEGSKRMLGSIAFYALWLEHDLVRRQNSALGDLKHVHEYESRLRMVHSLVIEMGVDVDAVAEHMRQINCSETRTERLNKDELATHFRKSMKKIARS